MNSYQESDYTIMYGHSGNNRIVWSCIDYVIAATQLAPGKLETVVFCTTFLISHRKQPILHQTDKQHFVLISFCQYTKHFRFFASTRT